MLEGKHKIREHAKKKGERKEREGEGEDRATCGFCQVTKNQGFPVSRGSYACLLEMLLLCVKSRQFSGKIWKPFSRWINIIVWKCTTLSNVLSNVFKLSANIHSGHNWFVRASHCIQMKAVASCGRQRAIPILNSLGPFRTFANNV